MDSTHLMGNEHITIYISHYPSRAPLFELVQVDRNTTLGKLKTVIEENVEESDLLERVRGQGENGEGGKEIIGQKRPRSCSGAQQRLETSYEVVLKHGEQIAQLAHLLQKSKGAPRTPTTGKYVVLEWYVEITEENNSQQLVELPLWRGRNSLIESFGIKENTLIYVALAEPNIPLMYQSLKTMNSQYLFMANFMQNLMKDNADATEARKLLADSPNRPLWVLKEVLENPNLTGTAAAMAIVNDSGCGLNKRGGEEGFEVVLNHFEYDITPLMLAVFTKRLDVAEELIAQGADVMATTRRGRTALHIAVRCNNLSAIDLLVPKMDLKSNKLFDSSGNTPMHIATEHNLKHALLRLLANGFDVNVRDKYENCTPLHVAAMKSHFSTFRILINHNADVGAEDINGDTPLAYALTSPTSIDKVRRLLELGSPLCNYIIFKVLDEDSPPLRAGHKKHVALMQALADNGCDIESRNETRKTPLHVAAFVGSVEMVEYLLSQGGDVRAVDPFLRTPLHQAICGNGETSRKTLLFETLIASGADIEARDNVGSTVLHLAATHPIDDYLLERIIQVSDVTSEDINGQTALNQAFVECWYQQSTFQKLLQHGACLNHRSCNGYTPLHIAAMNDVNVAPLLDCGGDPLASGFDGRTPLFYIGNEENQQLLFAAVANLESDSDEDRESESAEEDDVISD